MKKLTSRVKKVKLSSANNRYKATGIIVAIVFAGIGAYIIATTHAATPATLSLRLSATNVDVGGTFTVTIVEDSGTITDSNGNPITQCTPPNNTSTSCVNAIEADINYDQTKLQWQSSTGSTDFPKAVENDANNGVSYNAYAVALPTSGSTVPLAGKHDVATITFKALLPGTINLSFGSGSVIANSVDNTNILTGTTGASVTVSDHKAPDQPAPVTSPSQTDKTISLSWTAPADDVGVTGYYVYRGTTLLTTSPINQTTYTDNGPLTPKQSYSYSIKATDAAGNISAASTAATFSTTADNVKPQPPTSITKSGSTATSIAITWSGDSDDIGVTGYQIFRDTVQVGTSTTRSFNDSDPVNLGPNTTHSYTVKAVDAAGNVSNPSSAFSFSTATDTVKPDPPTNLRASNGKHDAITINWDKANDNIGISGYNIYRNGSTTKLNSSLITGLSYTDTGLTTGQTYSYTVESVDTSSNVSATKSSPLTVTITYRKGDVTGDDIIDISDYGILSHFYRQHGATHAMGDLTGPAGVPDQYVYIEDYSELSSWWHK